MASPSISISISLVLVVAWSATFAFPYYYAYAAPSQSSPLLQLEAEAIRKSGWWTDYTHNTTSSHCTWDAGIYCDQAGSVTAIILPYRYQLGDKFAKFNFSCFPNLIRLDLSENGLNGTIPSSLSQLTNLKYLYLSDNNLIGPIPSSLCQLTNLAYLYLDSNQINGFIPLGIGKLTNLIHLQMSGNKLSGPIPTDLWRCPNMQFLFLNNNNLSGSISHQIGYPSSLDTIDFSHNLISGEIPPRLGRLINLQSLYLSHNNLSGTIPTFLNFPSQIDLSYNALEGHMTSDFWNRYPPEAFIGNEGLSLPKNSDHEHSLYIKIILSILGTFLIVLSIGLLFLSRRKRTNNKSEARAIRDGNLFSIWNYDGRIAYEDIVEATEEVPRRRRRRLPVHGSS